MLVKRREKMKQKGERNMDEHTKKFPKRIEDGEVLLLLASEG